MKRRLITFYVMIEINPVCCTTNPCTSRKEENIRIIKKVPAYLTPPLTPPFLDPTILRLDHKE